MNDSQFTLFDQPKRCASCGETKPRSEFGVRKRAKDGLHCYCRECHAAKELDRYHQYRERRLETMRDYYRLNKGKLNEQARLWRLENPERAKGYTARWVLENPERINAIRLNYVARKYDAPGDGATLDNLIAIHGPFCYLCETVAATVVEHMTPLSRGGSNYPENLRPACSTCNSRKGNKTYEEYLDYLATLTSRYQTSCEDGSCAISSELWRDPNAYIS